MDLILPRTTTQLARASPPGFGSIITKHKLRSDQEGSLFCLVQYSVRKILALATCTLLLVAISGFTGWRLAKYPTTSLLVPQVVKEKVRPLDRYTYEALANRDWQPSSITIEGPLDYKPTTVKPPYKFKSYVFSI